MSPATKGQRATPASRVKPTVWREVQTLRRGEYAKFSARRGARRSLIVLRVTLLNTLVVALVTSVSDSRGCNWPVTRSDRRLVDAQIAVAKAWACAEADRLAGVQR